ncbi:LOW QUALITY PROTEIN: integrin alpha-M-like [Notolabrus celidotus]|uniref:LOW QUALITY PROTEIN: integrin alpha-M-like n=1 Tax=Notolabrus celidotus TaxID=1203425 RepID=UPI00148F6817|nr:LOW QUALITY PROTEIN: integrin alpha-M-like [Notolabrus celidotus]
MSLGLTMTRDPVTQNTLACGPTIPKDCRSITMYNGVCFQIKENDNIQSPMPSAAPECQTQADITFLLDGSGSVDSQDFTTMKDFVMALIREFQSTDTKFAIAQFSGEFEIHSYLNKYDASRWQSEIQRITQLGGWTHTGTAINHVVREIFDIGAGSRTGVKKVLIVVTDGQSNGGENLQTAVNNAERKKIVRFAIGVGNAFSKSTARGELETIASSPQANHIFQVRNFAALENIRQSLQEKIFSIEGSQSTGEKLKKEMSQGGFSAAYAPEGIQMGVVGANTWRGGFESYTASGQHRSSYEPNDMAADSYLGYSMAVAKTIRDSLTIVGAPRYEHRGAVMVIRKNSRIQMIDPSQWQFQSGEYFGAEVCAMDLDGDTYTDLILISAPMYVETDREGRVYVCRLTDLKVDCHLDSPLLLQGDAPNKGRFGSSLAVLPDLNRDRLNDLAVGAPFENDNQGSIYIFHGERGLRGINPESSQRIAGSEVQSGLMFFGMSISQSSFDQSGDNLPDLAVGSKGKVVLLRSKPIVMVEATVSYSPKQITQNSDCSAPLRITAVICFSMTRHSTVNSAQAMINYTVTLDSARKAPHNRAYFSEKKTEDSKSITLALQRKQCNTIAFFVEACPEDALNELRNELKFTFEGLPSVSGLTPSLAQQAQTKDVHALGFEINCGADEKCVDNLKVDFNFTRSSEVKVGIDELLDVTVSVNNIEEDSYNAHAILTYPAGLSYRKFTILRGRIECNSLDSEDGLSRGQTDCTIDQPIFKSRTEALFIVSYGIETNSQLGNKINVTANATSGNQDHSTSSDLYKMKEIAVKYSIFATIDSSLSYNNFSFGKNDLQKPVQQSIVVNNDNRVVNYTVVIMVPVQLGDKDIWVDSSSFVIPDCQRHKDKEPQVKDFVPRIQKNKIVDCSVARCGVFKCSQLMGRLEKKKYEISANLSSGWIEQIGLESAKFQVTSTATLDYDKNQYIFFSTGSSNNPPVRKIEAEVEVYPEPDFTKEIIGGSLGGLLLLALLTAGLVKAGFFKSKLQQKMAESAGEEGAPGADGDMAAPE